MSEKMGKNPDMGKITLSDVKLSHDYEGVEIPVYPEDHLKNKDVTRTNYQVLQNGEVVDVHTAAKNIKQNFGSVGFSNRPTQSSSGSGFGNPSKRG